jgi:GT2 family glycosyltransferase
LSDGALELAVVIATRNRSRRLAAMLASLRAQTLGCDRFELIVVDDGSTDDTPQLLSAEAERGEFAMRVIRHDHSVGPGGSRNAGWRLAEAPLIAFTDDDCVAEPGWLQAGVAAWGGDPERFVQGRTTPIAAERHLLGRTAYSYEINAQDDDFQTCNMFYPRALLERLNGFDSTAFPDVGEDTDLAWRALQAGARAVFAPDAAVQHAVIQMNLRRAVRRSWSWGAAAPLYIRHPALRRKRLLFRVFWNWQHYLAGRAWIAVVLPWSPALWPLKAWLARPWLADRARDPFSRELSPDRAAWFVVMDTVEMLSMMRGSILTRTLVI